MIDNATSTAAYSIHRSGGGASPDSCACYCHCYCLCFCPVWDPDSRQPNLSGPLGGVASYYSSGKFAWDLA